jgi:hypothetical protein
MVIAGPTTNEDTIWYQVQGPTLIGWIAGKLLSPDPNPDEPWPTPQPTPEPTAVDPGSSPPADVSEPTPVPVEEPPAETGVGGGNEDDRGGGRRRRRERRQDAWVLEPGVPAIVAEGALNLRSQPGLWADVLAELPEGHLVTIASDAVEADGIFWYQVVTFDELAGWCDGDYLEPA